MNTAVNRETNRHNVLVHSARSAVRHPFPSLGSGLAWRRYSVRKLKNRFPAGLRAVLLVALASANVEATDDLFELSLADLLNVSIVSATKSDDTVKDIPASVTLLTRQDIALMGYNTLEELLINLPGVYHIDDYEDYTLGVRGVLGGSIAFLINGVQQHPTRIRGLTVPERSRTNIPLASIDRIEFIRGPSSVIYGNNAFLGSINIITNDLSVSENKALAGMGENGFGSSFVRISRSGLHSAAVLNLGAYQTDGIEGDISDRINPHQQSELDTIPGARENLAGTLGHQNLNAELSGYYHRLNYSVRYSKMDYGFYPILPSNEDGANLKLTNWSASVSYRHPLTNKIESNTSFIASDEFYDFKADYFPEDDEGFQHQQSRRYELEQLFTYTGGANWQWVAGVNARQLGGIQSLADIQSIGHYSLRDSENVTRADAFFNFDYGMNDSFSLVGGFRYSQVNEYKILVTEDTEQVKTIPERQDDAVKLAALYSLNTAHRLSLSYSTATQDNSSLDFYEPEEISSREFSYIFGEGNVNLSVVLFDNTTEKIYRVYWLPTEAGFERREDNSGKWHTQGLEFISTYRPKHNLTLELSSTYQHSENKAAGEDDMHIAYSPELLAKARIGYGFSHWNLSGSLVYVDSMQSDFQIEDGDEIYYAAPVDNYLVASANVRYQKPSEPWYLNLHAFNLNDEVITYPATELVRFYHGSYGPGRQLVFSIGVDF